MKSSTLFHLSGLAAILAGLAFLGDTTLELIQPDKSFGIGLLVSLFGLYGLTGLFLRQREVGGVLNLVGYVLNFTGLAALIGQVFVNNFILPGLDAVVIRDLFTGPTLAAFITIGVIYLGGALIFGVALWRGKIFSRPAIALYMLGAFPVALPVFPAGVVAIGRVFTSLSIIWFGYQLWQDKQKFSERNQIQLPGNHSKSTLRTFMDQVWNNGDFSRLESFIAARYEIENDPGDPWDGQILTIPTFKERVLYSRNAFPDLHFEIQDMIEENKKVVVSWIMSGTHQGDLPQLPATGKTFSISGITIYSFAEGKLCGHRQAFDQLGFLSQVEFFN